MCMNDFAFAARGIGFAPIHATVAVHAEVYDTYILKYSVIFGTRRYCNMTFRLHPDPSGRSPGDNRKKKKTKINKTVIFPDGPNADIYRGRSAVRDLIIRIINIVVCEHVSTGRRDFREEGGRRDGGKNSHAPSAERVGNRRRGRSWKLRKSVNC